MSTQINHINDIIVAIEDKKKAGRYTDDYRLYEELADIYVYENNLEKAEEVIRYARELHPESGTGLYLEGYILAEKGDFPEAIQKLQQANISFPNNAEVIRILGWCYVMQGESHRGVSFLRRALVLAPDDTKILQNLSHALLMSEENV